MFKNESMDLPSSSIKEEEKKSIKKPTITEPLPESTRPRQDGPGGN
jgi:hypothetical protein